MIAILVLCSFVGLVISDSPKFSEIISTRSTAATGILMCGDTPATDVRVKLFRKASNDAKEVLSSKKTATNGHFEIDGDTAGRDEQGIEPMIRFYHRCDDDLKKTPKKVGYRAFSITYPKEYVTIGRVPRKSFNVGKLNLQIMYPKESRDMEFID
uniref:Transthyretin/hydroxyisourate hydrolase domain-containing protein n=1 Tax=Setaria digitata TaxID=48799 RepID=A0A915PG76_9BILA